jgi:hypothetical protein
VPDDAEGGRQLVLRCAWCDRIRDERGVWRHVPPEELSALEDANRLTHGMCPQCYARLTKDEEWADVG